MSTEHEPCPFCGCVALPDALPTLFDHLRFDGRNRLPMVEFRVFEMTMDQRASVYEWIVGSLRRPPLDRALSDPEHGLHPVAHFLHAIRTDLRDRVIDPGSPEAAGWVIPLPHPRVIRADRGEVIVQVEPGRSETRRVDGYGIELPSQGAG